MGLVRALVLFSIIACCTVLTQDRSRSWAPPQTLCSLDNPQVNESSGVASSGLEAGVFFTHNDSGDSARFFRFNRDGKVDGEYLLPGVKAIDWEDMAQATIDGRSYLYFGDFGDNSERRTNVSVYRVAEPTEGGKKEIASFDSYTLTYPDGPHNCEAMFVVPSGDIWVVTKNAGGISRVFVASSPTKSGDYKFRSVAELLVDTGGYGGKNVTGADVSRDGKHVVLRTYSAALEFDVPAKFSDWIKSKPRPIRLALEMQGEAIAYSKDGRSLVTTSEFAPCPVSVVSLKQD